MALTALLIKLFPCIILKCSKIFVSNGLPFWQGASYTGVYEGYF